MFTNTGNLELIETVKAQTEALKNHMEMLTHYQESVDIIMHQIMSSEQKTPIFYGASFRSSGNYEMPKLNGDTFIGGLFSASMLEVTTSTSPVYITSASLPAPFQLTGNPSKVLLGPSQPFALNIPSGYIVQVQFFNYKGGLLA